MEGVSLTRVLPVVNNPQALWVYQIHYSLSFINNTVLVAPSNHINNTMDSNNAGYLDNDDAASLASKPWPLLRQSLLMVVILSFAYMVVFFLSIVNNSLVIMVIYRNPQLRTITNIFIANLAVADMLMSILVLPITLLGNLFEGRWHHSLFITHLPRGLIISRLCSFS